MGKKLESNFTNMVVVLFSVTLIASAAVGYVYSLTAGPIEAAKQAKQVNAIREVIPGEFDNDPNADVWKSQTADGGELEFYPAKKNGELIGSVANYSVLEHKETPGLGSKMDVWFTPNGKGNITGKTPGTQGLKVSKDGGDVDAITAATISSRAFLDAVNRAAAGLAGNADAASGATQQTK